MKSKEVFFDDYMNVNTRNRRAMGSDLHGMSLEVAWYYYVREHMPRRQQKYFSKRLDFQYKCILEKRIVPLLDVIIECYNVSLEETIRTFNRSIKCQYKNNQG